MMIVISDMRAEDRKTERRGENPRCLNGVEKQQGRGAFLLRVDFDVCM